MLTIELSKLRFYAHHGFYEEEKILGGEFEVNVVVSHPIKKIPILHIDETIDYASVYTIIKDNMQQPKPLLETVATMIGSEILTKFPEAEEVTVSIIKINPPIIAFEGEVRVKCTMKR